MTEIQKNIERFAKLGLKVTEKEVVALAEAVKAKKLSNLDQIKAYLAEMRAPVVKLRSVTIPDPQKTETGKKRSKRVEADIITNAEKYSKAQGIRHRLPSTETLNLKRDPVTLEIIPDPPTQTPTCAACNGVYDRSEMIYFPVIGSAVHVCIYCLDEHSYKSFIGHEQIITKQVTETDVTTLKDAMAAAHPDRNPDPNANSKFIAAHKRFKNAVKLTKRLLKYG